MPNKKVKSAGRFGVRYGTKVKKRLIAIEIKQRKKQICPFCEGTAKRLSSGIWLCKKCKKKFAAHSYFLDKDSIDPKIVKEAQINKVKSKKEIKSEKQEKERKSEPKSKTKKLKTKSKLKK